MPPHGDQPAETRTLAILVDNEPGVLARVVGMFSARGYNIESLTVAETDKAAHASRITVVTRGEPNIIDQIRSQLERIVSVRQVIDVTRDPAGVQRELALVKVRSSGHDRIEALRVSEIFRARVIDTTLESFIFEMTGASSTPFEIGRIFQHLHAQIAPRFPHVVLSAHCHNDLGMAVANTLAAVANGAGQIEGAINGIGERAGNCALEEAVMALKTRSDQFGVSIGVDTRKLVATSRLLSELTSSPVVRNKAIVGDNAFAHEAGMHQHGMLADARTYEIMRPEDVGFEGTRLVLGKHSGRHALMKRAQALGYEMTDNVVAAVFAMFKRRADEIGEVSDEELTAIIEQVAEARADGGHHVFIN